MYVRWYLRHLVCPLRSKHSTDQAGPGVSKIGPCTPIDNNHPAGSIKGDLPGQREAEIVRQDGKRPVSSPIKRAQSIRLIFGHSTPPALRAKVSEGQRVRERELQELRRDSSERSVIKRRVDNIRT